MRRNVTGAFPVDNAQYYGWNAWDNPFANGSNWVAGECHWTTGAMAFVTALLGGPSISEKWSIISATVNGTLVMFNYTAAGPSYFGKLGTILADLNIDPEPPGARNNVNTPMQTPAPQLPRDGTLIQTLWDPSQDPLPPAWIAQANVYPGPSQGLSVNATIQPPNPIQIDPAQQVQIEARIQPSLIGSATAVPNNTCGLALYNLTYSVNYDDGL